MDRYIARRKREAAAAAAVGSTGSEGAAPGEADQDADGREAKRQRADDARQSGPTDWLGAMLPSHWHEPLRDYWSHYRFQHLAQFLQCERVRRTVIYPRTEHVFAAFERCRLAARDVSPTVAPAEIAVVIVGQDPYPGTHKGQPQAHGMSFSVAPGVPVPPSLINIFIEIRSDLADLAKRVDFNPTTGCLEGWARQGVFLLNTCLTVEAGAPRSHADRGWEHFTDGVIATVSARSARPVVFMLWGRDAQSKERLIDSNRHLVLKAAHPSPKSATSGFFGCRHFSKANAFLCKHNRRPINWADLSLDADAARGPPAAATTAAGTTTTQGNGSATEGRDGDADADAPAHVPPQAAATTTPPP
jgi:uracil-DNA glycosylase